MGPRTTIMILWPGRNAVSLELRSFVRRVIGCLLVLPLVFGIAAQRCWELTRDALPRVAMGSLERVANVQRHPSAAVVALAAAVVHAEVSTAPALMTAVRPVEHRGLRGLVQPLRAAVAAPNRALGVLEPGVISVKSIMSALTNARRRPSRDVDPATVPINGVLRLQALHLSETLSVRPFDDLLRPDLRSFVQINHVMRCRVTGEEIEMDPSLIGILAQLSTIYGRTLQLVSGHRAPLARGTSPTSQHTLGRAADIRIPGVTIDELKKVVIKLGARGVGLYPEKGFVHIDVRQKQRYYWRWTAREGEQADMGFRAAPRPARQAGDAERPEADDEDSELGGSSGESAAELHGEGSEDIHERPGVTAADPAPEAEPAAPAAAPAE